MYCIHIFPDPSLWFDPSTAMLETYEFYVKNLRRFTKLIQRGEVQKLLRPGQFSTEPPNNLDLILQYKDKHFGGWINSTKNK